MQKSLWLTICGVACVGLAWGQMKRQFIVENNLACHGVSLRLKANSGDCYIKAGHNAEILNIFSSQDQSSYSHQFSKEIVDNSCRLSLNFENNSSSSIGRTISTRVFGDGDSTDKVWRMY